MALTILHLGSTGYIGGAVLHALLQTPPPGLARLVLPVSSPAKAADVQRWRASLPSSAAAFSGTVDVPVVPREGPAWYETMERLASQADLAINAATSDDLELTRAINRGLVAGKRQEGRRGTLIHLSGVQLIESEPVGDYVETPLYDDGDTRSIASIPDSAAHRSIDLEIVEADTSGALWASIVCPALVWGASPGPGAKLSTLVPDMVRKALHNAHATYVGTGKNVWVHVSLRDCVGLITRLVALHLAAGDKEGEGQGQGREAVKREAHEGFYFASYNDDLIDFRQVAASIGHVLSVERGLVASAEPRAVPCPPFDASMKGVRIEDAARSQADADVDARTPIWPCRTNCRCIARRGHERLGWSATDRFDEEARRQDVRDCLDVILAEAKK